MAEREVGTVLVVDDDEELRTLLELVLMEAGYPVETAVDGRDALRRVGERMPGVILLDMRMPGMDGWTFAREFRARYGRACPIVVVTAAENAGQRAAEVDAEGFLGKPFDMEDLLRAVERYGRGASEEHGVVHV
jgi:CheY-like chemotaxis protein